MDETIRHRSTRARRAADDSGRAGCRRSRAGFSSSTSRRLRAKQLRRGARPRLDDDDAPLPHKAERVAMEEVRRGLVLLRRAADRSRRRGGGRGMSDDVMQIAARRAAGAWRRARCSCSRCSSASACCSGSPRRRRPPAGARRSSRAWTSGSRHQPMVYLAPTAPRGPADQLQAPELLEAAARKILTGMVRCSADAAV